MSKTSQKGFAPVILLFLIALIAIGAGVYFYGKGGLKLPTKQPASPSTQVSPTPTPISNDEWLSKDIKAAMEGKSGFKLYYPKSWKLNEKYYTESDVNEFVITLTNGSNSLQITQAMGIVSDCDYSETKQEDRDGFNPFKGNFKDIKKGTLVWRLSQERNFPETYGVCELISSDGKPQFTDDSKIGSIYTTVKNKDSIDEITEIIKRLEISSN